MTEHLTQHSYFRPKWRVFEVGVFVAQVGNFLGGLKFLLILCVRFFVLVSLAISTSSKSDLC